MGELTRSVEREFGERAARHPGRPDRELLEHLLVGLQRERVVAVGFEGTRLGERLARTPLPPRARTAIAHAMGRVWLDENMHARYILGLLSQQQGLGLQVQKLASHIEGSAGGWVVSVRQLDSWADAPVDQGLAALLEIGARLGGRLPAEVEDKLGHLSLREYAHFNADAEESAALSFRRMRELAGEVAVAALPDPALVLPVGFEAELARMAADETLHRRVFELFVELLDDGDGLRPGVTEDHLIQALEAIEGWLVPSALATGRTSAASEDSRAVVQPVGSGGRVVVARGTRLEDKRATLREALEAAGFAAQLGATLAAQGVTPATAVVAVKIDLMLAYHRDDRSVFTDPELVGELVDVLWEMGVRDIRVCESRNVYSNFYANRSVEAVANYVGLASVAGGRYRVVDLSLEPEPHTLSKAMAVYEVGRSWREAHVRISFAKLKTHVNALGQLALRNTGTVVPQMGQHFFSVRLADFDAVTMGLLHDFPVHFGLIDGYEQAADGLLGVLSDPTPKQPLLIVAGRDLLCVDYVGLRLMGERDPFRSPDLQAAVEWFGDPRERATVVGDLTPIADWERADAGLLAAPLSALSGSVYASLSLDGALFTADMDREAFPPLAESAPLAMARGALRRMLGIRRPRPEP